MELFADMRMADLPSEAVMTFSGIKGAGPRLFSRALALLEHHFKHPATVTPHLATVELVFYFIATATKFFDGEKDREIFLWCTQGPVADFAL